MMTNLLAILVSLAMMLTGASAPLAQPVSRTAMISDITVQHNDEEVTLSPYASIGVMTDGAKVLFDFFIGSDEKVFMPFQAVADESGIIVNNDNANVTLKLDKEKLETLLSDSISMSEEDEAIIGLLGDYMAAYGDILKLIGDPKASKEIQDKRDALFDKLVDRGAGQPGTVEYDDEIYDVTNYEYDLNAKQLGALTDAMFTADERLTRFYTAYFNLLKALPEDSGVNGLESFEQIMEMVGDVNIHVNESIAESGLVVRDMIMHISAPNMETPVELVSHEVKDEDIRSSEINADIIADDTVMTLYADAIQSGLDLQMDMTMTFNPVTEAQEADEETEVEAVETYDAAAKEDEEEEVVIDLDGEGDAVDAYTFTMDYDRSIDEERGNVTESLTYSIDASEQDVHFDMNIDGVEGDDGESDYQVTGGLDFGEESFGFGFTIDVSDAEIDERIDAAKAVSLDEFEPSVLLASVSADALNLYTDESVQKVIAMGKAFLEAAQTSGAAETDAEEDEEDIEDVVPVDIDPDALDLEMPEMTFANPQFNWLPEGYHVEDLNVDEEYQHVSLALVNDETDDRVYVDINNSYSNADINHYSLNGDGSLTPIEGDILDEEIGEGYTIYSMNDGTLVYNIFPSTDALGAEEIAHILSELTF